MIIIIIIIITIIFNIYMAQTYFCYYNFELAIKCEDVYYMKH